MRWLGNIWFRLKAVFGRRRMERDLEDEIAFHIEMETKKYREAGMDEREARRKALVKFGGEDRFKEETRESWGVGPLHDMTGDLRFAARQLLKHPAFTALAALTLALGIGGTVALSSVVHGLMLRPLPVPEEEEVMIFYSDYNWRGVEYDFVKERLEAFESVAAFSNDVVTLRTDQGSSLVMTAPTSVELFDVVDVEPLLGRGLVAGEDRPGAEAAIVLSHGMWTRHFGRDRQIVGRRIDINGTPTTVVGVMPEGFYFPTPDTEAWIPLDLDPATNSYHGNGWLVLAGRVAGGVSERQLEDDIGAMAADLGERFDYPDAWDKSRNPFVTPVREYLLGDVRPALLLLLGAVGLVLLMACTNVAALILTRTADRTGEMSVRAALGAGRARLARQILTESVLLGVVAGVVGVGLAVGLFDILVAFLPLERNFGETLSLNWPVLVGGMGLSVVTGALISLAPMRSLLRGDLSGSALGERSRSGTAGRSRLQGALVVAEVLLAVVLATGAGLLIRTVDQLQDLDPGLDARGVLTLDLLLPAQGSSPEERRQYFQTLLERTHGLPGVEAAGLINRLPIRDGGYQAGVTVEGRPDLAGDREPTAYYRPVTAGTFQALGFEIVRGRGILASDDASSPRVAVVNETFARRMWGEGEALGRQILDNGFSDEPIQVVGVVRNVAIQGLVGPVPMAAYYPWAQTMADSEWGLLTVRTALDPSVVAAPVRRLVKELDDRATIGRVETMEEVVEGAMAEPLRLRFFLGMFSLLGIVLGSVGVYGVVSYAVHRRRAEFGIRMALGAEPGRLLGEVVRMGILPVALGVTGGMVVALLGSTVLASFLFGVEPTDPVSFLSAAGALLLAGAAAALVPAYRASATDPADALRAE